MVSQDPRPGPRPGHLQGITRSNVINVAGIDRIRTRTQILHSELTAIIIETKKNALEERTEIVHVTMMRVLEIA
ncbi:MAG: hypothetical protein ACJAY2_000005 [Pseudomonadales bacterium]|jgi:hypothetical protein